MKIFTPATKEFWKLWKLVTNLLMPKQIVKSFIVMSFLLLSILLISNKANATSRIWVGVASAAGGAGTDFNTAANWSPAGIPGSGDDLTITFTKNLAAAITLSGSITVNSLTIADNSTPTSALIHSISTNAWTLTINGALAVTNNGSGTAAGRTLTTNIIIASGGTLSIGTNLTATCNSYTPPNVIAFQNSGTMTITGTTLANDANNAAGNSHVDFLVGNSAVTTFNGAATFDDGTTVASARIQLGGTVATSSGKITFKNNVIIGTHCINAAINASSTAQTYLFDGSGQLTTNNTTQFNFNNLQIGSTANPTITRSGSGVVGVVGDLTVNGSSILDLGTSTLNRTTSGGTFTLNSTSQLKLSGSSGGPSGSNFPNTFSTNTLASGSTVVYYGGAQTIYTPNYGNLTVTNAGIKTAPASTLTVAGSLTLTSSATFTASSGVAINVTGNIVINSGTTFNATGSNAITVGGNWTNAGTYNKASETVTFNGSLLQTIFGSSVTAFNSITISNSAGVALNVNASIGTSGILTFSNGILTTTGYNFTVLNTTSGAVNGSFSSSKCVVGPLTWALASGTAYSFPVGKGGNYYPFAITPTTGGALQIQVEAFSTGCGGSPDNTTLASIGTPSTHLEYWYANIASGTISAATIGLTSPNMGSNNLIGRTTGLVNSTYASIQGSASSPSITGGVAGSSLGYFVMGAGCNLATAYSVTGGGLYCGSPVAVGLSGSQANVSYQLKRDGTNVGSTVPGTGAAISFPTQTVAGTYTVVGTGTGGGYCYTDVTMTGSVAVTVIPGYGQGCPIAAGTIGCATNYTAIPASCTLGGFIDNYPGPNNGEVPDEWYSFVVPVTTNGVYINLSTCGTGWDEKVHLWDGSTELDYNDDNGPVCQESAGSIIYGFPASGGTYYFVTDGYALIHVGNNGYINTNITYSTPDVSSATITGIDAQCPGLTSQTYTLTGAKYATSYSWSVPTGWTITSPSPQGASITVTAGTEGQNGSIYVTPSNDCITGSPVSLAVTVGPATPATPGAIGGATSQCPSLIGQVYSISSVTGATTYTWTVPTGWTITGGQGFTSLTVKTGTTGQNGNITVTAGNNCGTSSASTLGVTVGNPAPATPGTITGVATQCPGLGSQTYSISAVTNATTYTWSVPTGWTINSAQGLTSITVTTGSAGQNGNVSVTAGNSCGTSSAKNLAVTVSPATPAIPGAITGLTIQCPGRTSQTYSITAVPNTTTYTWTVPTGWTITSPTNSNSINVTTGANGQNGNITVTAGNSCGTSTASSLGVTVVATPATPGSITGSATQCPGTPSHTYSIVAVSNATTYTWGVPTGWTITAGNTTTSITVTAGSYGQDGNITVTAGNNCGTSSASSLSVSVNPNAAITSVTGSPTTICISGTTTYTTNGVNLGGGGSGAWSSDGTAIATVNGSGLVTGASAGSCNITYTITGGCSGTKSASQAVTINPDASIASVSGSPTTICATGTTTYSANSVVLGGGTGAWSSDGTAIATVNGSGLVTGASAGSCNITYTITGGCSGTKSASRAVTVNPDASIASVSGSPTTICATGTTTYSANSVVLGGGTGAWSSDGPAIATVNGSGLVTGASAGSCNITYTITGGCSGTKTASQAVTVNATASITSVTGSPTTICASGTTTYSANGVILGGGTGAWSSSAGTASVNASGVVTGLSNGTANIIYTITGGCNGTASSQQLVTVSAPANTSLLNGDYVWSGNSSSYWGTSTNWLTYSSGSNSYAVAGSAPTSSSNVYFRPYTGCVSNPAHIAASCTVNCNNITIESALTMDNSSSLNVAGNWINNGTFTSGNNLVTFVNTSDVSISGSSPTTFYDLTMNSDGHKLTLSGGDATITHQLTLTSGNIETGSNNLIFSGNATSPVESTGSRIIGNSFMQGRTVSTSALNFLGLNITAGEDIGTVSITRVTGPAGVSTYGSNSSIECYWNITASSQPSTTGRNISFSWLSDWDGANVFASSAAEVWKSEGGGPWANIGTSAMATSQSTSWLSPTVNTKSFSKWTVSTKAQPLPVGLLSFSARCLDDKVNLNWSTASETNNDYFTVERSKDYYTFEKVLEYAGAGNSNHTITYDTADDSPYPGYSYYRLKQTDYNGASTYLGVIPVNCGTDDDFNLIAVIPGMQQHEVVISFEAESGEAYNYGIYDITGQILKQGSGKADGGFNEVHVNLTDLTEGLYIVILQNNEKSFSRKIILR